VWCDVCGSIAPTYLALGQVEELRIVARELEAAGLPDHDERRILAWSSVGLRMIYAAEFEHADRMIDALERAAADPKLTANSRGAVYRLIAHRALITGDLIRARELSLAAVDSYLAAGNVRDGNYEQIAVVSLMSEFGEYDAIVTRLRGLVAVGEQLAIPVLVTVGKLNLAPILALVGDPTAEEVARAAVASLEAAGDVRLALAGRCYLTRVMTLRGQIDDAVTEGAIAVAGLRDQADPTNSCYARAVYAEALIKAGRAAEAVPLAREAVKILDKLGRIDEGEIYIRLMIVEALLAAGHSEPARIALVSAHAALEGRAERILDPALREAFFTKVPEHARTLALAREHGLA